MQNLDDFIKTIELKSVLDIQEALELSAIEFDGLATTTTPEDAEKLKQRRDMLLKFSSLILEARRCLIDG